MYNDARLVSCSKYSKHVLREISCRRDSREGANSGVRPHSLEMDSNLLRTFVELFAYIEQHQEWACSWLCAKYRTLQTYTKKTFVCL